MTATDCLTSSSRTVADLFVERARKDGDQTAFQHRRGGQWIPTTWQQFHERATAVASMLIDHGLEPGDKVCVLGSTGLDWCCADIAGHLAGAVVLGAYPTLASAQLVYIIEHSDARVVFVEGRQQLDKLLAIRDQLPKVTRVCVWGDAGDLHQVIEDDDWLMSMDQALAFEPREHDLAQRQQALDPESTAIIIYTSGTTGPPKGAMLSHSNILAMLAALETDLRLPHGEVSFVFLPMAHVAERVLGFYYRISTGMCTAFATNIPSVLEEVQQAKPFLFGSVPRIFEKAYARIMSRVDSAPPMRQKLFRWAERVGREVVRRWQAGQQIPWHLRWQYKLANRLVFSKLRDLFGGRVHVFVTGAAPIAPDILEFFWGAGLPIYEAYGMTESSGISHINAPFRVRLGTVGHVVPNVEERIAEDGEILVRGPTVFKGYYKDPEATSKIIDKDGWLHTGDIGRHDADGYLQILDRKKHIIITAGGKNLTPANIENEIKGADSLISQAHAHGDKRPYVTALITLGPSEVVDYAVHHDLSSPADAQRLTAALTENPHARPEGLQELMQAVTSDPAIHERIIKAVKRANSNLARVETVKKFYLLEREFSLEHDELTPTFKVKRKNIEAKFARDVFDRFYEDESFGIVVESRPSEK